MKAIVVKEKGRFECVERPMPKPGGGEVLVEVGVAGLCRTDLKLIEQGHRDLILPRVPGEEVVGYVRAVGKGVDESWIKKRVYLYPGTSCGHCRSCRHGAGNLCVSMRIMGFHRDGGFADYVVAPESCLIAVPERLDFDAAVFAEPLSCCLNAIERADPQSGDRALLFGAGPAGTLLARVLTFLGVDVTIVEPDERRRVRAGALAEAPSAMFDIVIPAVGDESVLDQSLERLAPRGRLVVFSGLSPNAAVRPIDVNRLHYLEQTVVGAYGCSYRHGVTAIKWLAAGSIKVDDMISHRLPLTQLDTALDIVRTRTGMKVLLYPSGYMFNSTVSTTQDKDS